MKIAIVGAGISGLTAAFLLHRHHEITIFEAGSYLGGHTNTIRLHHDGRDLALDTGFMVFNDRTYPNFVRLLKHLGVAAQPSDMSFSVKCDRTGFEYCGSSLNTLFAQRSNLLRPSFYRMLSDIVKFNRRAPEILASDDHTTTLQQFVSRGGYGAEFVERYLIPMGAAIWSAPVRQMEQFPARYFIQFCHNHGLLSLTDRPQWQVIRGGADTYVAALSAPFRDRVRLNTPVRAINREGGTVQLRLDTGEIEQFEHVILAVHADLALRMLRDPSWAERDILTAFPYQENETVLHTDATLLPRRRLAWASWNYHLADDHGPVAVTYLLNKLQSLDTPHQYCVTLNRTSAIRPECVLRRIVYHHPLYSPRTVSAQRRHAEISGHSHTHFCGAYWGYGFHEDGVNSALAVARYFGQSLDSCIAVSTPESFVTGGLRLDPTHSATGSS